MDTELAKRFADRGEFDVTPAGAALLKFRRTIIHAVHSDCDEEAGNSARDWGLCYSAEQELIAEIRKLQTALAPSFHNCERR